MKRKILNLTYTLESRFVLEESTRTFICEEIVKQLIPNFKFRDKQKLQIQFSETNPKKKGWKKVIINGKMNEYLFPSSCNLFRYHLKSITVKNRNVKNDIQACIFYREFRYYVSSYAIKNGYRDQFIVYVKFEQK